jgi:hypothetical protein
MVLGILQIRTKLAIVAKMYEGVRKEPSHLGGYKIPKQSEWFLNRALIDSVQSTVTIPDCRTTGAGYFCLKVAETRKLCSGSRQPVL